MKIIFLMLDSQNGPWGDLFSEGAEKTWALEISKEDQFFRYQGIGSDIFSKSIPKNLQNTRYNKVIWPLMERKNFERKSQIRIQKNGRVLEIDIPDRWSSISTKSLTAFKYCLEHTDFDFLIRGNATSYFNLEALKKFLNQSQYNYVGPIQKSKPFASGWSIGLSREATEYLIMNFTREELKYFDDEAFGRILTPKFGCASMPFLELDSLQSLQAHSKFELKSIPAIRTKSIVNGTREDALIQNRLHYLMNSLKTK